MVGAGHTAVGQAAKRPRNPISEDVLQLRLFGERPVLTLLSGLITQSLTAWAHRVLLGITSGNPHLAAQGHDGGAVDHGGHQLVLGDVVRESVLVAVFELLDAVLGDGLGSGGELSHGPMVMRTDASAGSEERAWGLGDRR